MAINAVRSDNLNALVSGESIVLIDCWAPWCAACRDFAPTFERVAEQHPKHAFATLNTEDESELVAKLEISHVPALLLFRDGILLFKQPGYMDEQGLKDVLAQAEGLDMDVVRAHLEQELESA